MRVTINAIPRSHKDYVDDVRRTDVRPLDEGYFVYAIVHRLRNNELNYYVNIGGYVTNIHSSDIKDILEPEMPEEWIAIQYPPDVFTGGAIVFGFPELEDSQVLFELVQDMYVPKKLEKYTLKYKAWTKTPPQT